jgi:hypothetical protein
LNNNDDSILLENKNYKGLTKPTKSELKRLILELDRSVHVDPKLVFKWPIEVWISMGEAFIQPDLVSQNESKKLRQKIEVNKAELELEKQSHIMRLMTGRRLSGKNQGQFKSCTDVPYDEKVKEAEVNILKVFKSLKNLISKLLLLF